MTKNEDIGQTTSDNLTAIKRMLHTYENLAWWVEQGYGDMADRETAWGLMTRFADCARVAMEEL